MRALSALIAIAIVVSASGNATAQDAPPDQTSPNETPPPGDTASMPPSGEPEQPPDAPAAPASTPPEAPPTDAAADATAEPAAGLEPREITEAKERIARAESLFDAGDYDAALIEFKKVHELLRGHPLRNDVRFNIGKCYEKLFLYDDAMRTYRRYLEDAPADAEDRAAVTAKVEALEALLGTLEVSVNRPHYEIWVDNRNLGDDKKSLLVPGGTHVVEVRAPGYLPARAEVTVASGDTSQVRLELEKASEYEGLDPLYFWVSSALAVVSLGAGALIGISALNEDDALDRKLEPDNPERWRVDQDDIDAVKDRALLADIFFGAAIALGLTSGILAFLTDWGSEDEAISVDATAHGATLYLRGAL